MRFILILFILSTHFCYSQNGIVREYACSSINVAFLDMETNERYGETQLFGSDVKIIHNVSAESFHISYTNPSSFKKDNIYLSFVRYEKGSDFIIMKDGRGKFYSVSNNLSKNELSLISHDLAKDQYLSLLIMIDIKVIK